MEDYINKISSASEYILSKIDSVPEVCIVLGSGLAPLASMCDVISSVPYGDIPGFPVSTAPGHEGRLIYGVLEGKKVFMMSGRFHYYEGYDLKDVTLYVRVMARLGVKTLVLTNAAGGILDGMKPASLMIIKDHLSFFAESVLRGANLDEFGVRFPDQTHVYDPEYIDILDRAALRLGINVRTGVYAYSKGPQYETPAEIRALKMMGAGAVGMSTVPEAIVASHCGMRVAAVSCISNLAAGISPNKLTCEEVIENAGKASADNCALIKEFVKSI
ncbi:purine-nucleoside phosphorylase [Ruminococcaceae bacterium YRB3002]|nr:purine-nucleoside phosphorylase [Ruminococcaceae bacterium YRB3002]